MTAGGTRGEPGYVWMSAMEPGSSPLGEEQPAAADPAEPGTALARTRPPAPSLPSALAVPVDVALGAAALVVGPAVRVAGGLVAWLRPPAGALVRAAAHPPFVPQQWAPGTLAARLETRGRGVRTAVGYDLATAGGLTADVLVPVGLDTVLDRVELTDVVLTRVDLARVITAALDQVDLTAVVLEQVDLRRVVAVALDSMDLTDVVVDRVDLARVIMAALDAVDLTEVVRTRVDVSALAEEVIEEVDLPEIIRESSTGIAADVVQGARIGAIGADEKVSRLIDRVLLRRRSRDTEAPGGEGDDVADDGPAGEGT